MSEEQKNERMKLILRLDEQLKTLSRYEIQALAISVFGATIEEGIMNEETIKKMMQEIKQETRGSSE